MYGNPAFDCSGAQVHAVCRQLATVVTVDGVVDDTNIERVAALALRFVIAEKPFVLDLSNVSSFSAHSVSLLSRVDERCFNSGVEWDAESQPTRCCAHDGPPCSSFPVADSVPDALHYFGDCITERRCLLPILTKKTA